jgi:predicted RNA-binding protein YlqC (UPF0109 family)
MKELLEFIVKNLTGNEKFSVEENEQDGRIDYLVLAPKEFMGLIIGKEGKTIRAIRNLVKVRATLEKKAISVSVAEKA